MERFTPNALKRYLLQTPLQVVLDSEPLLLAKEIHAAVQDAWTYCHERPRWASWWDQTERASCSVALNYAEALGKGRGYFVSAGMIARGEAYEVAAALAIGPVEVCNPLIPKVKELCQAINRHLTEADLDAK